MQSVFDKYQPVSQQSVFNKYQPVQQPKQEGFDFGKSAGDVLGGIASAGSYAVKGFGDVLGNTAQFAGNVAEAIDPISNAQRLTGVNIGYQSPAKTAANVIQGVTNAAGKGAVMAAEEGGKVKEGSTVANLGYGLGNVAGVVGTSLVGGGIGSKAGQAAGNLVSKYAPQVGKYISPALKFGAQSVGSTQGGVAGSEGRIITPGEAALGLGIDTAALGIGKVLKGVAKRGLSQLPNFTNKQASADEIKRLGNILYQNAEQLPMTANRPTIGGKIKNLAQGAYNTKASVIDDLTKSKLPAVQGQVSGTQVNDILENAYKEATSEVAIKKAGISLDQIPDAVKKLDQIKQFYQQAADQGYSLAQLEKMKESFGKKLFGTSAAEKLENIYRKSIRSGLNQQVESQIGKASPELLSKFKGAKQDYAVLAKAGERLKNTPKAYSGYLTDVILGGAAGGGEFSRGDVLGGLKNAATAIAIKHGIKSPVGAVGLARTLKAAQPYAMPAVQSLRNLILQK